MWRAALIAVAGLGLAACDPASLSGPPARSVVLTGGVAVAAPDDFCVDPVITKPRQGFALLAACAAMTSDPEVLYPAINALITIQSGAANSAIVDGDEDSFRAFLDTPQGAALLGASTIGGPLAVRRTRSDDNAVSVYTQDVGPPGVIGTQAESWRLFTDIKGRLVTISVRGLAEEPLSEQSSRVLIDRVLALLRAANTATAPATES